MKCGKVMVGGFVVSDIVGFLQWVTGAKSAHMKSTEPGLDEPLDHAMKGGLIWI